MRYLPPPVPSVLCFDVTPSWSNISMAVRAVGADLAESVDHVVELMDHVVESIDRLISFDPDSFSDSEFLILLERQRERLECVLARAVECFAKSRRWRDDEAESPAAWLSHRCQLSIGEARAQLRRARSLEDLPVAAEAYASGIIGTAQFDALARVQKLSPTEEFARVEASLVQEARAGSVAQLTRHLDYWIGLCDQAAAEKADQRRKDRRRASFHPNADGMVQGRMTFDPVSGVIVTSEHRRLEKLLFEADWAEAKARLGREPTINELARTPEQRSADAVVEMASRSKMAPKNGRRPEPLFTIVVDYPTLDGRICQLEGGSVLAPGTVLPHMDGAWFERVVFKPGKRAECSVKSRFFTGATRRAIEVRDLECTHKGCEIPAAQCQIDHIVPYSQGGLTIQENGRVLCPKHNRGRIYDPVTEGPGLNDGVNSEDPGDYEDPREYEDPDQYDDQGDDDLVEDTFSDCLRERTTARNGADKVAQHDDQNDRADDRCGNDDQVGVGGEALRHDDQLDADGQLRSGRPPPGG
jgi:hypothetical protein